MSWLILGNAVSERRRDHAGSPSGTAMAMIEVSASNSRYRGLGI
jgi:hypothetical protein